MMRRTIESVAVAPTASYTRAVHANRVWTFLSVMALAVVTSLAQQPEVAPGTPTAVPAARRAERVAIFTIEGPIDAITLKSLERRMERARADGVDAVVIELDTPGGETSATLDICRLIKREMPPNTVAWIRPKAYSAGTLIALATREIVVTPDAVFGDSAPIAVIPGMGLLELPQSERAKIEGPLLSEVIDSARRNHWDEQLVQGFVAVGIELWMLEDVRTGERVFVDRAEYRTLFGEEPPALMTSATAPAGAIDRKPVRPFFSDLFGKPPRRGDAARSVTPESQRAQIEFEQVLPTARPRLDPSERDRWRLVAQVDAADRLLTVRAGEALAFGLAAEVVPDDAAMGRFFGAVSVQRYQESWSEGLVRFLVSWPVRLTLVAVMILCFLVELAVPGFGLFGVAAFLCLVVLIGAPALAGLAQWWQLALVVIGLALVLAELAVFPGTIVIGLSGAVIVLVGVAGVFVQSELSSAAGQRELLLAIGGTLGATVLASTIGGFLLRRLGGPKLLRHAVLSTEIDGRSVMPANASDTPDSIDDESDGGIGSGSFSSRRRTLAPGARGIAHTDLRPTGKGVFDGTLYDVRCVEGYLEQGLPIRVVRSGPAEFEVENDRA